MSKREVKTKLTASQLEVWRERAVKTAAQTGHVKAVNKINKNFVQRAGEVKKVKLDK